MRRSGAKPRPQAVNSASSRTAWSPRRQPRLRQHHKVRTVDLTNIGHLSCNWSSRIRRREFFLPWNREALDSPGIGDGCTHAFPSGVESARPAGLHGCLDGTFLALRAGNDVSDSVPEVVLQG